MGAGKILLGVAVGIGAVAAAPFTGGGSVFAAGVSLASSLAGAGAAAAGAAAAGAAAGVAYGKNEDHERERERHDAKSTGFKDGLKQGEKTVLEKLNPILKDVKEQNDYMIGITAFCYAVAYSDGEIQNEESIELDYYLNYIKNNPKLSPIVLSEISKIQKTKLTFSECKVYLDKIKADNLNGFSEILANIINADEVVKDEERQFKQDWAEYYDGRKRNISC